MSFRGFCMVWCSGQKDHGILGLQGLELMEKFGEASQPTRKRNASGGWQSSSLSAC